MFSSLLISNLSQVESFSLAIRPSTVSFLDGKRNIGCRTMLTASSSYENMCNTSAAKNNNKNGLFSSLPSQFQEQESIQVIDTKQNNTITAYDKKLLKPPPPPTSNPNDDIYRRIRKYLPLWVQNSVLRDSGLVRFIMNNIQVLLQTVPKLLQKHPHLLPKFLHASSFTKSISYGPHPLQTLDILVSPSKKSDNCDSKDTNLVVLVHGGGWGSGRPWMYRLAALPFLKENTNVAVIGYRTYPDGNATDQVQDLEMALSTLLSHSYKHVTVMGHSSGAHIALLMIFKRLQQQKQQLEKRERKFPKLLGGFKWNTNKKHNISLHGSIEEDLRNGIGINTFIGLAGPYWIPSYFDYEIGRGIDAISPMSPSCGLTSDNFVKISPTTLWKELTTSNANNIFFKKATIPNMIFIHGVDDDTVPYTSTIQIVNELTAASKAFGENGFHCKGLLLQHVGHPDTILHFILGGPTQDIVLRWLTQA